MNKRIFFLLVAILTARYAFGQDTTSPREHLLMDRGWRFAFGHPYDTDKDFKNGTGYFSYFAKAGYGDGAAAPKFDDRAWRTLDLPHDWAVEQPFDPKGSFSHGFKAIGRNFPDASVGWYRKTFIIPASDLGRHISIAFDGVFRNSIVWVNGHYLGTEESGYSSFEYNISQYLNYGGENVIAVRVDATMEEGWFYEGAGIYRHVWLNKTNELHVARNGTFVTTKLNGNDAIITTNITVANEADSASGNFSIKQDVLDADGKTIAMDEQKNINLKLLESKEFSSQIKISNPNLWSVDTPYLHKLVTTIIKDGTVVDRYETTFGIRTIRFDADKGFFLNGKHLEITGTDNHQDHAGLGVALPDALQDFRIKTLKSFGCNAYRCSHNPPTPELLDACDRLGMLVLDENRLMGVTDYHFNELKQLMLRDRNHPSVIAWSIGNEEWGMENTSTGARVAATMQAYAKTIDSTRYVTAAFSGGVGNGISTVMDLLGYNYIANKNTDEQHAKFPKQFSWGTEEGATVTSRGIYVDDKGKHQVAAYDRKRDNSSSSIEQGWQYYAARPYLAGMFIWTGFDYRGEPTPFGWPSIYSYHGMLDACGFPKDDVWYLKSWWTNQNILHILPHWNWKGKEGQDIQVWAYSNSDEVELFLNKKSLGKKTMPKNGHLEWTVAYEPGKLEAIGYKGGKEVVTDKVETTGDPVALQLTPDRSVIKADKEDVSVIKIQANDKNGLPVPTADNEVSFTLQGPGKIIGVGNGNETSLEPDKYLETVIPINIENLKEKLVDSAANHPEVAANFDAADWQPAFKAERFPETDKTIIYRGSFTLPANSADAAITYFYHNVGKTEAIYINGKLVAQSNDNAKAGKQFKIEQDMVHAGENTIAIVATPFVKKHSWDTNNTNPGTIQVIVPAQQWKRKLFNGLAQVIVQSTGEAGDIILTATSPGLKKTELKITAKPVVMRAEVASVDK